jgi:7-carboxy-7-deazaguanine synthase
MKINEIFFSLQGEGLFVGIPTVFIRTTGCNLRCSYCDTTYAYSSGTKMSINEIFTYIEKYPSKIVCLTGGEPLAQRDIGTLIQSLLKKHFFICLETNGSFSIKRFAREKSVCVSLDMKCPSSGSSQEMLLNNIGFLTKKDQLKFIINDKKDFLYAKEILEKYKPLCPVFFQPVWGTDPAMLASWILQEGLSVRLSLQLHKLIWGTKKGV